MALYCYCSHFLCYAKKNANVIQAHPMSTVCMLAYILAICNRICWYFELILYSCCSSCNKTQREREREIVERFSIYSSYIQNRSGNVKDIMKTKNTLLLITQYTIKCIHITIIIIIFCQIEGMKEKMFQTRKIEKREIEDEKNIS